MTGQLQEARWLIKNMQQRFETIHRVTQAIVERQKQFLNMARLPCVRLCSAKLRIHLVLRINSIACDQPKYMATPVVSLN